MTSAMPNKINHRCYIDDCIEPGDHELTLMCPACGCDHLHQSSAEVFFREQDAETGQAHLIAEQGILAIPMECNPSARRDGIRINFFCEECDYKPSLEIVQHKGYTLMSIS
jgi:hypothetical protein